MHKQIPKPDFPRPKIEPISEKEQKYFIAYIAYGQNNCDIYKDIFNDIVYIDEEITSDLLSKIEDSLLDKINNTEIIKYFGTQIVNIVKL